MGAKDVQHSPQEEYRRVPSASSYQHILRNQIRNGLIMRVRESVHPCMLRRIIFRFHNRDIVYCKAVVVPHEYFVTVVVNSWSLMGRGQSAIEPRLQAHHKITPFAHLRSTSGRHPHVLRVHKFSAVLAKEADLRLEEQDIFLARHI